MNRRSFLKSSSAVSAAFMAGGVSAQQAIQRRPIPSSGEQLPVIGLGTWQTFDVGDNTAARERLSEVLQLLKDGGASVVDSSPMYGTSEGVVGDIAKELGLIDKLFMASKVWTTGREAGIAQLEQSANRMQKPVMDLMQVHNLQDAEVHLQTLKEWKKAGKIRYIGLTHYHSGGYPEMLRLMSEHEMDFIQINYSILDIGAEREILPLAQKRGIATLINRPFESGQVFNRVKGHALPELAADFGCASWGQFFLKFLLANPAVTCVIPGTSKVKHLADNLAAGRGKLPTEEQALRMRAYVQNL